MAPVEVRDRTIVDTSGRGVVPREQNVSIVDPNQDGWSEWINSQPLFQEGKP